MTEFKVGDIVIINLIYQETPKEFYDEFNNKVGVINRLSDRLCYVTTDDGKNCEFLYDELQKYLNK